MKKETLISRMLLEEPIKNVFELEYTSKYQQNWHNAHLHTIGVFEYHVTEGYWLLFETDNYYASIGHDGVQIYKKPYVFPVEKFNFWNVSDDEWTDYKETLFIGQKIHLIEQNEDYQSIYFDYFKLNLYIYGEAEEFNVDVGTFGDGVNVMAVGSHLLKRCECGGKGELLIDERSDYAVRCKECHKATYFDMILKDRIEAWNTDDAPCIIDTGREELQNLLKNKHEIKYVALPTQKPTFEMFDNSFCACDNVIIAFEDTYFMLSWQRVGGNKFDFTGSIITDYNRNIWSGEIKPDDHIAFVQEEEDFEGRKTLRFKLDDVDLLIAADPHGLAVALDETQLIMNCDKIKRKTLF